MKFFKLLVKRLWSIQSWWPMPVIQHTWSQKQGDYLKFQASLCCMVSSRQAFITQ